MKKVLLACSLAFLLIPSAAFSSDWRHWNGHRHGNRHGHGHHGRVVIRDRHHHDNGAAIIVGVLGGIATGIILDRVLTTPPAPQPVYKPPPPPHCRDRGVVEEEGAVADCILVEVLEGVLELGRG